MLSLQGDKGDKGDKRDNGNNGDNGDKEESKFIPSAFCRLPFLYH